MIEASSTEAIQTFLSQAGSRPAVSPSPNESEPKLPSEMIALVAEKLDTQNAGSALRNLQMVSKEVYHVTTPWLYRTFIIKAESAATALPQLRDRCDGDLFKAWKLENLKPTNPAPAVMRGLLAQAKALRKDKFKTRRTDFTPENAWLHQIVNLQHTLKLLVQSIPPEACVENLEHAQRVWKASRDKAKKEPKDRKTASIFPEFRAVIIDPHLAGATGPRTMKTLGWERLLDETLGNESIHMCTTAPEVTMQANGHVQGWYPLIPRPNGVQSMTWHNMPLNRPFNAAEKCSEARYFLAWESSNLPNRADCLVDLIHYVGGPRRRICSHHGPGIAPPGVVHIIDPHSRTTLPEDERVDRLLEAFEKKLDSQAFEAKGVMEKFHFGYNIDGKKDGPEELWRPCEACGIAP